MKYFKIFLIPLFIIFSSLTGITYAESLKFDASTYEGEVKKGKAHGVGVFTFSDGSTYEGKVKSNKIHGKGKYTDAQGKVYEGKFSYGSFKTKIDKKTRDVIKLKPKTGVEAIAEIKGTGSVSTKWFAAEKNSSGIYVLTAKGKREMDSAISSGATSSSSGSSGSSC
ncbi:hypothetical protein N9J04_00940 [Candidatus Pelagibacter sp.]|nr:hypothetical protein [Candidatus Pelagibacter sp.]